MAKILVTDGGYSHALAIIRSLNSKGHIVDCIGRPYCLSSFSKSLNKCSYKQSRFKEYYINEFLLFLDKNKYDFLIPIGADSVNLVNKNRKEIQKRVIINIAPFDSVKICLEKPRLLSLAQKIGLSVPKNYAKNELYLKSNNEKFVVKPISELSNDKVLYLTKNQILNSNLINGDNFLIQEYINGSGFGFFAIYDHGKLKNFFMHRRIRENPPSGGSSVCAESTFEEKLFNYGTKILDKLKWHGVAMVEFKQNSSSGEFYLMEINPKFWASHDLAIEAGINFAEKYLEINPYKKSILKPVDNTINYKLNFKFQWLARDISSSLLKPKRLLKVVYYFLFLKVRNNLFLKDPLCTIYLFLYAFLSPIAKSKIIKIVYSFLLRVKLLGLKIAFVRTFTELSGIPILKYSLIDKNIAIGMQPSFWGIYLLQQQGFSYLLNLRSGNFYENINLLNFELMEIPVMEFTKPTLKQLDKGSEFINKAISMNSKVYIHCREGVSRAPCFAAAFLIKFKNLTAQQAIDNILRVRSFVNILPSQRQSLIDYEAYILKKTQI